MEQLNNHLLFRWFVGFGIFLVFHLNKGSSDGAAILRVAGSGAFVAACLSSWLVAPHPSDEVRRILTPLKNNLGDDRRKISLHNLRGDVRERHRPVACRIRSHPVNCAARPRRRRRCA